MTYKEARVYLDSVSRYGSVLGLESIRNLLNELGNPQNELKFIHIAGTNGKGSTLGFISTILSEAGYRTGRYSSPSVLSYLEMIQIDGQWISKDGFAKLVDKVKKAIACLESKGQKSPTVFEIETAIAFLYFYENKCDYVVLETGLGGIEDATNVVKNTVAAVFAVISRDHMGILGNTLGEIAEKKAGIIKSGCTVVSAVQNPEAVNVLKKRAEDLGCPIIFSDAGKAVVHHSDYKGSVFSYKKWEHVRIRLSGSYQITNVITALEFVDSGVVPGITEEVVRKGLEKTEWVGRFTCIQEEPIVIIDGAHNEDAAVRLRESVETYFQDRKKTFICGVFKDKEYERIAEIMAPLADRIYTVELPNKNRTLDAGTLCEVMKRYSRKECLSEAVGDIFSAVNKALGTNQKDEVILVFGSLSYLRNVIECVNEQG